MIEQAIRQGDESVASGLHMGQLDSGQVEALNTIGGEHAPDRRVTAESFRLLLARLNKPAVAASVAHPVPEPMPLPAAEVPVTAAPVAVEAEPAQTFADVPEEPAFEAPEIEAVPAAPETEIEVLHLEPVVELPDVPVPVEIEPVQELASRPELPQFDEPQAEGALPEPEQETAHEAALSASPAEPAEIELEVQTAAVETPAVEPEAVITPAAEAVSAEVPSALPPAPTSVEIEGIGEIAKAIYMTPTSADRTAFLAECAAMAAAEIEAEQARAETPAIIYSEQHQAPQPKIRRLDPVDDPFAKITLDDHIDGIRVIETDEDAGELARSLLDMMLSSPSAGLPQERALAADALLKLVPRIPLRSLVAIVERVSIMESPPHLLVTKLINDPRIEVAGPLLELCNHISDQVLSKVVATGQVSLQRLIARRRHISAVLSDQLIQFDDTSVILTLVRNNGVTISHGAFSLLADHARRHPAVLAPLATRADLPAPIAFELFWFVPAELRRYLLSRFLTDSETLTKILKITQTMQGGENSGEVKFPERDDIEMLVKLLQNGRLPEAAEKLAEIGGIHLDSALRIVSDRDGEPLAIMFKALGTNRARFSEIIEIFKSSDFGIIRSDRESEELKNVFDSMSFNKARVLLTYWDWAALKSGPYAPAN